MITLTVSPKVLTELGSATQVDYDKLVLRGINYDTKGQTISGTVEITASSDADSQSVVGSFEASVPNATLKVVVGQLDFSKFIRLTSAQNTALLAIITDQQDASEKGFITLNVVDGIQATGA